MVLQSVKILDIDAFDREDSPQHVLPTDPRIPLVCKIHSHSDFSPAQNPHTLRPHRDGNTDWDCLDTKKNPK